MVKVLAQNSPKWYVDSRIDGGMRAHVAVVLQFAGKMDVLNRGFTG